MIILEQTSSNNFHTGRDLTIGGRTTHFAQYNRVIHTEWGKETMPRRSAQMFDATNQPGILNVLFSGARTNGS